MTVGPVRTVTPVAGVNRYKRHVVVARVFGIRERTPQTRTTPTPKEGGVHKAALSGLGLMHPSFRWWGLEKA